MPPVPEEMVRVTEGETKPLFASWKGGTEHEGNRGSLCSWLVLPDVPCILCRFIWKWHEPRDTRAWNCPAQKPGARARARTDRRRIESFYSALDRDAGLTLRPGPTAHDRITLREPATPPLDPRERCIGRWDLSSLKVAREGFFFSLISRILFEKWLEQ